MTDSNDPDASEQKVLWAVLAVVGVFLIVQTLVGRFGGHEVELEDLPRRQFRFRIDANRATEIEWMQLPGIGPKLAQRIVADRKLNGPFQNLQTLQRVRGVGPKLSARIAPYVSFGEASHVPGADAAAAQK